MASQNTLTESAGRNLAERIKAIKEGGDGYMTVVTAEETESVIARMKQTAKKYREKREAERRKE